MDNMGNALHSLLFREVSAEGRFWFEESTKSLGAGWNRNTFLNAFSAATLRLGKALVELPSAERHLHRWWIDELGRTVLLFLAANWAPEGEYSALIEDCYVRGENRERQAVMRALSHLPQPERFVSLAAEACRTSVLPVFESIACENRYPARYFPELNFNQMVIKALFNDVALERVVGLAERLNPELIRMASAYAREREAAGRGVPDDIARFIATPRSAP